MKRFFENDFNRLWFKTVLLVNVFILAVYSSIVFFSFLGMDASWFLILSSFFALCFMSWLTNLMWWIFQQEWNTQRQTKTIKEILFS